MSTHQLKRFIKHADVIKLLSDPPPNLRILDCSSSAKAEEDFSRRSLPGANLVKMSVSHEPGAPLPYTCPTLPHFIKTMKKLGVKKGDTTICYGQDSLYPSSRIAFLLRAFGNLETYAMEGTLGDWKEEHILQEGEAKYEDSEQPVEGYEYELESSMFATFTDIKDAVVEDKATIIDCRSPVHYNAIPTPPRNLGHIPNAINIYSGNFIESKSRLKEVQEIEEIIWHKGISKERDLIIHCQIGFGACVPFNIFHSLGYKIRLYDESWIYYVSFIYVNVLRGVMKLPLNWRSIRKKIQEFKTYRISYNYSY